MCNTCIQKFDHHCVWINSCVGLYNYRYFLMFLFLHSIICSYGSIAGYYILRHHIDEGDLYNKVYVNQKGERFKATFWIVLNYLQFKEQWFLIVFILCIVVTVMLWLFFLYHMYLVKQGYTTAETMKAT